MDALRINAQQDMAGQPAYSFYRTTHPLDEVLSDRPITIKRFSHIMFPAHSVSLTDFARCLERCAPVGCVVLDVIEDGSLHTERYEDWMRNYK